MHTLTFAGTGQHASRSPLCTNKNRYACESKANPSPAGARPPHPPAPLKKLLLTGRQRQTRSTEKESGNGRYIQKDRDICRLRVAV